ncbi:MAG: DUF4432 family protein [Acidimicrobiia bacterium]
MSATASRVDRDDTRALDLRAWKGFDVRLLPDRGFDIGPAWFAGHPVAWVSAVGETGPIDDLSGFAWSQGFGGGLMVTCGLRNVGMPSEGHGLHGTFSHLAAETVAVSRVIDGATAHITARAVITDDAAPGPLRVERVIRNHAMGARLEVSDRTTNLGNEPTAAPLLYHFNFGYPLWGPGARLSIPTGHTIARDVASRASLDSWQSPPHVETTDERVLEHEIVPVDGWGAASIRNEALGIELSLHWRFAELPRLHQWIDPSPGMYVLGIEPANCSTMGRAHDRAEGRLPHLDPGETRDTTLVVTARRL